MRKRYDLRRSDNYMLTGRVSYVTSGSGSLTVVTGSPVMRATVSFATIPSASTLPRVYVSGYTDTGFTVAYEDIAVADGYIEFDYSAV